jgi:hypothetical protein
LAQVWGASCRDHAHSRGFYRRKLAIYRSWLHLTSLEACLSRRCYVAAKIGRLVNVRRWALQCRRCTRNLAGDCTSSSVVGQPRRPTLIGFEQTDSNPGDNTEDMLMEGMRAIPCTESSEGYNKSKVACRTLCKIRASKTLNKLFLLCTQKGSVLSALCFLFYQLMPALPVPCRFSQCRCSASAGATPHHGHTKTRLHHHLQ